MVKRKSFIFDSGREMPLRIRRLPLLLKILMGSLPVIIAICYLYIKTLNVRRNKEEFYKRSISSVVVKSHSSEGRTMEFLLKNDLKLYFWLSVENQILVGDSIYKSENTFLYDVYRKNLIGEFKFYATYDFLEME